jgi:hypothetical protein
MLITLATLPGFPKSIVGFAACVFGKFLTLTKAKNDGLDLVILEDRAAQDTVRGRLSACLARSTTGVEVVILASLISLSVSRQNPSPSESSASTACRFLLRPAQPRPNSASVCR